MRMTVELVREKGDRRLPREVFVRDRRPFHRPQTRYSLRIRSQHDVETARRAGVPVYLLEPWIVEALGYPLFFKPRLLLPELLVEAVDTTFRVHPLVNPEAALHTRLEDVVVAMLKIDPLGARRLVRLNTARLDRLALLRRILQEGAERRAARVRLGEFVPGLPLTGEPISPRELSIQDMKEYSQGLAL